jgi:3-hydroxy-3-methylglutaryl CoA synthase/uncharacterized OB-fold protein
MKSEFVSAMGTYLPRLRLDRKAAAQALKWSGQALPREGRRAVCDWDEDPVTLATEAARGLHPPAGAALIFASTSAPFYERAQASLVADALSLPLNTRGNDVSGSRRCAASALIAALESGAPALVTSGERRPVRPGASSQLLFGDGGAAALTGTSGARLLTSASISTDFVDSFASRGHPDAYSAEERFVRDAGAEMVASAIERACGAAHIAPSAIAHAAVVEPASGCYKAVSTKLGLKAPNHSAVLAQAAGDLGAAHPLFALALAFGAAQIGDIVLFSAFGSGCEVALFKLESAVLGADATANTLHHGAVLTDYVRFLNLTGELDFDWGPRAEIEQKAQPTVLSRNGRDMLGFVGGRDRHGNVQFPKSRIPVSPNAEGPEPLEDIRLADELATIISFTADRLNYTPDPPFYFGLVQFDNGARVMMEFVDIEREVLKVGDRVRMRLRIKSLERKRGFRTYFWKAAPVARLGLEG